MRYHYKKSKICSSLYGQTYYCNHPIYNRCTLFLIGDKGLSIIQQRFNNIDKSTYWTEVDSCLINDIYLHPKFKKYFDKYSKESKNGIYPTITVRQIMWALKMKPLKREIWETYFCRKEV